MDSFNAGFLGKDHEIVHLCHGKKHMLFMSDDSGIGTGWVESAGDGFECKILANGMAVLDSSDCIRFWTKGFGYELKKMKDSSEPFEYSLISDRLLYTHEGKYGLVYLDGLDGESSIEVETGSEFEVLGNAFLVTKNPNSTRCLVSLDSKDGLSLNDGEVVSCPVDGILKMVDGDSISFLTSDLVYLVDHRELADENIEVLQGGLLHLYNPKDKTHCILSPDSISASWAKH